MVSKRILTVLAVAATFMNPLPDEALGRTSTSGIALTAPLDVSYDTGSQRTPERALAQVERLYKRDLKQRCQAAQSTVTLPNGSGGLSGEDDGENGSGNSGGTTNGPRRARLKYRIESLQLTVGRNATGYVGNAAVTFTCVTR